MISSKWVTMESNHQLVRLASLIKERNEVDARISEITGLPANIGALGEHIASLIFSIELADSRVTRGIDGWFRGGPFDGKSVNIKWYGQLEGLLDVCLSAKPDCYLVLSGPRSAATKVVGPRPLLIHHVHIFDSYMLESGLGNVRKGVATSVRRSLWDEAEIFPEPRSSLLTLTQEQREALKLFR